MMVEEEDRTELRMQGAAEGEEWVDVPRGGGGIPLPTAAAAVGGQEPSEASLKHEVSTKEGICGWSQPGTGEKACPLASCRHDWMSLALSPSNPCDVG
jgi:hypothetical protein